MPQATNAITQQHPSRPPTNPISQQLPSRPPTNPTTQQLPSRPQTNPITQQNPLLDESLKANLRAKFELSQINRGYTPSTQKQLSQAQYDEMARKYAEESEEEDYDEEEEYEEELEVEDDEESPRNFSLLQRSASSSRMKGLFNTVLQKSASGASLNPKLDISQFKANLTRHLQRRESFTGSQVNVAQDNSESEENDDESDEDCFEDCSEVPLDTKNYYRLPL